MGVIVKLVMLYHILIQCRVRFVVYVQHSIKGVIEHFGVCLIVHAGAESCSAATMNGIEIESVML